MRLTASATKRRRSPKSATLADRFWLRVDKSGECWNWTGILTENGYGRLGAHPGTHRQLRAHRVSWELAHGPVPDGRCVLHRCDNRRCVRPDHLFLGTQTENVADMVAKGRNQKGERSSSTLHPEIRQRGEDHFRSKLTTAQVLDLRRRYDGGERCADLARAFGVSFSIAFTAAKRISWRHLP